MAGLAGIARAQEKPANDPKAVQVVEAVGKYYLGLKQFTTDASMVEEITAGGKSQRSELAFAVAMERPNKFAMALQRGRGGASMFSDGSKLYTFVPDINAYNEEPAPADLAGLVKQPVVRPSFLAQLIDADPAKSVMEGVMGLEYRGVEQLDGRSAHHLAAKQKDIDWELWVDEGDQPLVRKVKVDVSRALTAQGAPSGAQGTVTELFSKWTVNQPVDAAQFSFTPPAGAKTIEQYRADEGKRQSQSHPLVGRPAPDFSLPLLAGGQMKLSDNKGKQVVVLDFWATWCPPCQAELPVVNRLLAGYKDKGVLFVAVNQGEDANQVRTFLQGIHIEPTVALDAQGSAGHLYQVSGIPQTVIIDKQGIVRAVFTGYGPGTEDDIKKQLDEVLAGGAPAAGATPAPATPAP
jgi:alkyl hydroperoxide reductase subunit AhpC